MTSGLVFLALAKRSEIAELEQLARTGGLVDVTGRLIHALQRERGLGNLYLGSQGTLFAAERQAQVANCQCLEAELHACFDGLDADPARFGSRPRLFSRIAYVLQGLDALPALRARIDARRITTGRATAAYVRLIAGLLAVVFEAADSAPDPEISRLLVAMFNFMQGKEFAGQERAIGSAVFASGLAAAEDQQRLAHLIESQERCFGVFEAFASREQIALRGAHQHAETAALHERLRRVMLTTPPDGPLPAGHGETWFDCCTRRIDEMKRVEDALADALHAACGRKIASARTELDGLQALLGQAPVHASDPGPDGALPFFDAPDATVAEASADPAAAAPSQLLGPRLERSVLELVQEQSCRLQSIRAELDAVRATLNERKIIERAKGLLMAHRHLSEEQAHKAMRDLAMSQNRRLLDIAEAVLATAELLPGGPPTPARATAGARPAR